MTRFRQMLLAATAPASSCRHHPRSPIRTVPSVSSNAASTSGVRSSSECPMLAQSLSRSNWLRRYSVDSSRPTAAAPSLARADVIPGGEPAKPGQPLPRLICSQQCTAVRWAKNKPRRKKYIPSKEPTKIRHTGKLRLRAASWRDTRAGRPQQGPSAGDGSKRPPQRRRARDLSKQ